ncbi:MAG: TolC family protein [Gemmatimonadaceae bacterium]
MRLFRLAATLAFAGSAAALPAQTLTLRDALARADTAAFANRIADGAAAATRARSTAALRGILPTLRLEGGFVRTDDPIGVFGTALRQRSITAAHFDPARLNQPDAINNFQGGAVVEQPLFNADAWVGRRAAARAGDAADAVADWGRTALRVDVIRAWYGVTLARERVATLAGAARAAHAHVGQAESMVRQGLATRSDALLAAVGAGEVDAQLADAEAEASTALRQLAVLLGERNFSAALPESLPSAQRIRAVVASDTIDASTAGASTAGASTADGSAANTRADVEAAEFALGAARLDAWRARSLYLPRLNALARYDWNSASRLYAGIPSWTVGVMATWTPFAGASELAERQVSKGNEAAARAMAEAARARASLEAEQAGNALRAALAGLAIAERAVEQSAEAHRMVARKYEGGLATIVELLDASAVETRSALRFSAARHAVITSAAERRKALGRDPATLVALEDPAPTVPPTR